MENKTREILVHKIIWYIIIFSIIGLIIETIFCYLTTGIIESRKGLIWGPFCPVYGVGATILIILLERYKNNPIKLFIIGSIAGNIIEYILSYILEAIYGIRFWDYSYVDLNLNGRICIRYSVFWGMLAVILIKAVKPYIDKIINKIPNLRPLNVGIIILLVIDCIATVWAISTYQDRALEKYYNIETINQKSLKNYIGEILFSNDKMKKTFPNLRYTDEQGKEHYLRDMIKSGY
ncbi:MAG: putative ABC transporter permease [Clostridia bacterium]|nr:putative ABC transporter permease [Clostridia bacterium]